MVVTYGSLMQEYLGHLFASDPVRATRLGIHAYDDRLTDFSTAAQAADRTSKQSILRKFEGLDVKELADNERLELPFVLATLRLALEFPGMERWGRGLKQPDRAPQIYPEMVSDALFPLMAGDFADVDSRIDSLRMRLAAVPEMLASGLSNLTGEVPPLWVEMARSSVRGATRFLEGAVLPFAGQSPLLAPEVGRLVNAAAQALLQYDTGLVSLSARARGEFAAGRDAFDYLLRHYHMVDMDSNQLYEFGLAEVERYRAEMCEVSRSMGYGDDWISAIESVKDDFPEPEDWVKVYDYEVDLARRYVSEHNLVTIPAQVDCPCEWMPVFMRDYAPIALPWSSPMFDPGYSGKWYITPLDADAPESRQKEHMRDNSYAWIRAISHHEIYPGHYMQALIVKLTGTPFRKVFSSPIYVEGWSMYWEEFLREHGFLAEPRLHLMQLRLALWRAVRIVVDTGLHARGMGEEEAVSFLVGSARLERRWAESQIRGYSTSPTYQSSYLLGKKAVMDLKQDYRRKLGASFSDREFHDTFLSYGSLPVALVAAEMLAPSDKQTLEEERL